MNTQSGNVLFLILIAVALFAALAYAVTKSQGSGKNVTEESADAAAADILSWFSQLDAGVMRMRVINNIDVEKLDFNDPGNMLADEVTSYPYDNGNCTDPSCEIFSAQGGGVAPRKFLSAISKLVTPAPTASKAGHWSVSTTNTAGIGSSLPDISIRINFVSKEICSAINRRLGIPETFTSGQSGVIVQYQGNLTQIRNALASASAYTWTAPEVYGKPTFCLNSTTYGSIWHVVAER